MRTRTTMKEQLRRLHEANQEFMEKYLDLVSFARWGNADPHLEKGDYQAAVNIMGSIKEMRDKYPEEVSELQSEETDWTHGFNSGVLAYVRFISEYVDDGLWEVCEDNESMLPYEKVVTIKGKKYIEFDGRENAREIFPDLST